MFQSLSNGFSGPESPTFSKSTSAKIRVACRAAAPTSSSRWSAKSWPPSTPSGTRSVTFHVSASAAISPPPLIDRLFAYIYLGRQGGRRPAHVDPPDQRPRRGRPPRAEQVAVQRPPQRARRGRAAAGGRRARGTHQAPPKVQQPQRPGQHQLRLEEGDVGVRPDAASPRALCAWTRSRSAASCESTKKAVEQTERNGRTGRGPVEPAKEHIFWTCQTRQQWNSSYSILEEAHLSRAFLEVII